MKRPSYIARLSPEDTAKIHRDNKRVIGELSKSGLSKRIIERRIQTDLTDVYQRLSMACAYEQTRIQYLLPPLIQKALDEMENLYFVTFGRPQDRVPPGSLMTFDPENLNRHLRRRTSSLKRMGVENLKVFAVVEVQLVKPLDGPPYWEPHLHLIVSGATADQLKEAFKVRKLAAITCRKRPVQVKRITDLEGMISYCLKFHPKVQVQYLSDAGLRWRENRMPSEHLPEWFRFMSRHSPGEMLKFVGINASGLDKPLTAELSLDFSEIPRGRR
jgi:hypothetical protein